MILDKFKKVNKNKLENYVFYSNKSVIKNKYNLYDNESFIPSTKYFNFLLIIDNEIIIEYINNIYSNINYYVYNIYSYFKDKYIYIYYKKYFI